jgi:hypothetical protein
MLVILCMVYNKVESVNVKVWILKAALRLNKGKRAIRGTL